VFCIAGVGVDGAGMVATHAGGWVSEMHACMHLTGLVSFGMHWVVTAIRLGVSIDTASVAFVRYDINLFITYILAREDRRAGGSEVVGFWHG
jgi:hypothetical protein